MKPEDIASDRLAILLNANPALGQACMDYLLGTGVARFAPYPIRTRLGHAKPDIVLWDASGVPRVYIEAKITARAEPIQLLRGRNAIRNIAGSSSWAVCLLAVQRPLMPPGLSFGEHLQWFQTRTWTELRDVLSRAARSVGERAGVAAFTDVAARYGAFGARESSRLMGLQPPSGHDYGATFSRVLEQLDGWSAVGCYGARISPALMLGHRRWAEVFGSDAVERINVPFHLPQFVGWERYAFQVLLWDRHIYPDSKLTGVDRVALMRELSQRLGARWSYGMRQHAQRTDGLPGTKIPEAAAKSLVGLICLDQDHVFPPFRSEKDAASRVLEVIHRIEVALDALA